MQTQQIFILDPGTPANGDGVSPNLGDKIIQGAVTREIVSIFGAPSIARVSTHRRLPADAMRKLRQSQWVFVGGSNLLGNMTFRPKACWWWKQWRIGWKDAGKIGKAILLGVGWRRYEGPVGWYTRRLYRTVLSGDYIHSVRDDYTKAKLESIGICNVMNTGCPTLWPLVNSPERDFPTEKGDIVLATVTDYKTDPKSDGEFLGLLCQKYREVYLWPQGQQDRQYAERFHLPLIIMERSLTALDDVLQHTPTLDYVGTRLHGGIRCLLAHKRTLILSFGNRAKEMLRNRGLETIDRGNLEAIRRWVDGPTQTRIMLDRDAIMKWKSQFVEQRS